MGRISRRIFCRSPYPGYGAGVSADSSLVRQVKTFIPGMIMTIDGSRFPGKATSAPPSFHRLFAPGIAHTTTVKGRTCTSCHNDPLALGYGRGRLEYQIHGDRGIWRFTPEYAPSEYDGLPEDAWIGFLATPLSPPATRSNARPFTIAEQQRILTVGACLTCHDQDSPLMLRTLTDYNQQRQSMSERCVLPEW